MGNSSCTIKRVGRKFWLLRLCHFFEWELRFYFFLNLFHHYINTISQLFSFMLIEWNTLNFLLNHQVVSQHTTTDGVFPVDLPHPFRLIFIHELLVIRPAITCRLIDKRLPDQFVNQNVFMNTAHILPKRLVTPVIDLNFLICYAVAPG